MIDSKKTNRTGRPTTYTTELADLICERIALGESLTRICQDDGMPAYSTTMKWRLDLPPFSERYARAREDGADALADEILALAKKVENGELDYNAGRVAIDALKWTASKLKPKSYGDKTSIDMDATVNHGPGKVKEDAPVWLRELMEAREAAAVAIAAGTAVGVAGGTKGGSDDDEPTQH